MKIKFCRCGLYSARARETVVCNKGREKKRDEKKNVMNCGVRHTVNTTQTQTLNFFPVQSFPLGFPNDADWERYRLSVEREVERGKKTLNIFYRNKIESTDRPPPPTDVGNSAYTSTLLLFARMPLLFFSGRVNTWNTPNRSAHNSTTDWTCRRACVRCTFRLYLHNIVRCLEWAMDSDHTPTPQNFVRRRTACGRPDGGSS